MTGRPLAVVTGASSGIGYELAKQFARHGYDLLVAAEDPGITPAARDFGDLGAAARPVQVDLASYDGVELLCRAINGLGGPVDAAALNAGVGTSGDFARETDLGAELKLLALNVVSPVHLAKRLLPGMVQRGTGRLLFTSSITAAMPGPYEATYAASKAFVFSFAEAIRYELRDTGVTVTTLLPGPTETHFFERAGLTDTKVGAGRKDDPAEVARAGFDALLAGKDHVVGGALRNRVQMLAGKTMPPAAAAALHGRMSQPRSAPLSE